MKVFILPPDASGRTDGALKHMLLDHFPNQVQSQDEADVVIVPIARMQDYKFNPALRLITKPWVILDYFECEWNFFERHPDSLIFGRNGLTCAQWFDTDEWFVFDGWVSEHPPAIYFKRELLKSDRNGITHPCDWPCRLEIPPVQSEAEFNARPIEVFHCWGYSHPSRPKLHGAIFEAMATKGIEVTDLLLPFAEHDKSKRNWHTIYAPHWRRRHINDLMAVQSKAKLSVALPGAGVKTFRHGESPVNCVMALPFDDLAWSYKWESGVNCVRLEPDDLLTSLLAHVARNELYQIYVAGQETASKYQFSRYIRDYIQPIIEEAL